MCPANTFSAPGATECSKCNEVTEYAGKIPIDVFVIFYSLLMKISNR